MRASRRTGTPGRARPTATLAGLPPAAASNSLARPAGTRSISASPTTAIMSVGLLLLPGPVGAMGEEFGKVSISPSSNQVASAVAQ